MSFQKVNVPITELIKSGFHVLVEVILDSMFPIEKKMVITQLFEQAYKFMINFVYNNRDN